MLFGWFRCFWIVLGSLYIMNLCDVSLANNGTRAKSVRGWRVRKRLLPNPPDFGNPVSWQNMSLTGLAKTDNDVCQWRVSSQEVIEKPWILSFSHARGFSHKLTWDKRLQLVSLHKIFHGWFQQLWRMCSTIHSNCEHLTVCTLISRSLFWYEMPICWPFSALTSIWCKFKHQISLPPN